MKLSLVFRIKIGLTQQDLAQYLQITRSQLSMYEKGKRDLPTSAMLTLAQASLWLDQPNIASKVEKQFQKAETVQEKLFVKTNIINLEYEQLQLQRNLQQSQEKYEQGILLQRFAKQLATENPSLANLFQLQASKTITKFGKVAQTQLRKEFF